MNAPLWEGYGGLLLAKSQAASAARQRQLNKSIMSEEETKAEITGILPSMVQIAQFKEHDAWTEVCKKLQAIGAVTQADMEAPQSQRQTPGQELFHLIREWGKFRIVLAQVKALQDQSKLRTSMSSEFQEPQS